ncbi:MAG: efflux RND transporter periplasmic adaptor subunit [Patescibacteria group bacterium]|jgi:multidrug efflux pump subunit AcrA (membrane-fusion protein)
MVNIPKPQKKKFYKKWWFWLIMVFLLIVALGAYGGYYTMQQVKNAANSNSEQEATAEIKDLVKTVSLEGKIQSKKEVALYFGASGEVIETHVQIGDVVKEDQLLAKIDADGYPASAKEIKAPFAGVITNINIFDDMLVTPQTAAITLSSEETEISATASENEVLDLKAGQKATITFGSLPDVSLEATVISVAEEKTEASSMAVSAAASAGNSGYEIKLDYSKPSDLILKRDLSCDIEIVAAEKKSALSIPLAAVKWEDSQAYVNIKNGTTTEKRDIKLGFEGDENTEVLEGLKEGEKIIMFSAEDLSTNSSMF